MIAPNLPEAALIPCAVERKRVGKSSPGMMNVVVFGPKFYANNASVAGWLHMFKGTYLEEIGQAEEENESADGIFGQSLVSKAEDDE